jgi:hypothetical protein
MTCSALPAGEHALHLLKRGPAPGQTMIEAGKPDQREGSDRIRCPLCEWEPPASSRWCCHGAGTPEAPFHGCDAIWNTFDTRGRCPGCAHQWRWTSCLRCDRWSLHEDWYEHAGDSKH